MPQGKVKKLVSDRGFGFIEGDRGDDLFFHHTAVQGATLEELREGQLSWNTRLGKAERSAPETVKVAI